MINTEAIKSLISEGKILEAIDQLQSYLSKNDLPRYNQTLLLEAQLRELIKKQQLGLQDSTSEMNRISLALLHICDEIKQNIPNTPLNLTNTTPQIELATTTTTTTDEGEKGAASIALWVILAGLAIIGAVIYFAFKKDNDNPKDQTEISNNKDTPSVSDGEKKAVAWSATPNPFEMNCMPFGQFRFTVIGVERQAIDAENDRYIINLKADCLKSAVGTCSFNNHLTFGLISATDSTIIANNDDIIFNEPDVRGFSKIPLEFIVPNGSAVGGLRAFFADGNLKKNALIRLDLTQ